MKRLRFVLRRLLQAVPTILLIVVINFFLLHLAPGDAAMVLAGEAGSATPEYMAELARAFRPRPAALCAALHLRQEHPLARPRLLVPPRRDGADIDPRAAGSDPAADGDDAGRSRWASASLLGLLAATGLRTWRDNIISVLALLSYATPLFWLGLMLIVVFSIQLGWLPTSGMETIGAFNEGWERVVDIARHLVLPAVTLSLFYLAVYTRLMRASMLEQAGMDYVTTARAKGLTERRITFTHVLRNAMLPVVTMAGVQIGGLLGGSVVVETIFGWPGLGLLAFQSLFARDLNLLLGIFFLSACLVVVVNLLVDLLYASLDPRIEMS